jgi:hypothetical protein
MAFVDNEVYINTSKGWVNLQGPQGIQGPPGPAGPQGGNSALVLDPWHTVGGAGENAPYSSAFQPATVIGQQVLFRKDPFGRTKLRGVAISKAAFTWGQVIFTLPASHRPLYAQDFEAIMTEPDGTTNQVVQLRANPDGTVAVMTQVSAKVTGGAASGAIGTYIRFDGWEFDTDTVTQYLVGPQGAKGDPGGVNPIKTLNWNTATTPGFYRSTNDGVEQTLNGPGDTLNPPPTIGYVQQHENGTILQRAWDLSTKKSYSRYWDTASWSVWTADPIKPPVWIDAGVSMFTPEDGDERYFQNAAMKAAGILWKFRYDKTAPSGKPKWVFAGGQGFYNYNDGDNFYSGAANTWGDAGPADPVFTIPLQGDYFIEFGALVYSNLAGVYAGLTVALGSYIDVNHPLMHGNFGGSYVDYLDFSRTNRYDAVAAGTALKLAYYSNPIGGGFQKRYYKITPIRVVM